MFFDAWDQLGRVMLVGVLAYVALVVILRLSGKRTLAKLSAFDLVITVALGSTLATIVLSSDVSLAEGVLALVVLVSAQFVVAWTSVRWGRARAAVTSSPTLLVHDGCLLAESMARARVTADEVRQAVRASGFGGLDLVAAVVLESDGSLSVIPSAQVGNRDALVDRQRR